MNGSHQNQLSFKVTRYHVDVQDSIPRRGRDYKQAQTSSRVHYPLGSIVRHLIFMMPA